MMPEQIDKKKLLNALEPIPPPPKADAAEELFNRMSISAALPALTEIDIEREYRLCHSVAEHLLGKVPEPEQVELD